MSAPQQCPKCASPHVEQTMMGYPFGLDRNRARCVACGWLGLAYETKQTPGVEILVHEIRALEARIAADERRTEGVRISVRCDGCGYWLDWSLRLREPASKFACRCDPPRQRVAFERSGDELVVCVEPFPVPTKGDDEK